MSSEELQRREYEVIYARWAKTYTAEKIDWSSQGQERAYVVLCDPRFSV